MITNEMVQAYRDAWHRTAPGAPGDRTRAGLTAALDHMDPAAYLADLLDLDEIKRALIREEAIRATMAETGATRETVVAAIGEEQ